MARLLPIEHLLAVGLEATLYFDDDEGLLRLFNPCEILAALFFFLFFCVVIPGNLPQAYQQVGNASSPVHEWVQVPTHKNTHSLC